MAKRKRVKRPKSELEQELKEQLELLQYSCDSYDSGFEAAGKHIALSLRILLHQHGQSRALLEQLGLRDFRYLDTAGPLNPRNLVTECNFLVLHADSSGSKYMPSCQAGMSAVKTRKRRFADWWNNPVLKDNKSRKFCRRDLVLHVADTDGGAHVDPELDEAYMEISRKNSLNWYFTKGNITEALKGRPELACMRQIAHELLLTLQEKTPKYFKKV
ncbi:MAG TPA: hypothetical protein ENO27_04315 [Caldithrix sp.]|nr:hypothetical protein [Caldithrix sp.]